MDGRASLGSALICCLSEGFDLETRLGQQVVDCASGRSRFITTTILRLAQRLNWVVFQTPNVDCFHGN